MKAGFTLVELLVVISVIGVLMGLTILGLQGARESARDAKRKSDVEFVRAGLEFYKADCKKYPIATSPVDLLSQSNLRGDGSISTCATTNVYISQMPKDANDPTRAYKYYSVDGVTYQICASLEGGDLPEVSCGTWNQCGAVECNYAAANP